MRLQPFLAAAFLIWRAVMYFILFVCIVSICVYGMFAHNERRNRELLRERLRRAWGKRPEDPCTADQMERLSAYGKKKSAQAAFALDEITWRDLDMDRIFALLDATVSAPGEEYLLYLLRTPLLDEETLWERERMICAVAGDEQRRLDLQMILSQVPKSRVHPVGAGLQALEKASPIGKNRHRILCAAAACSLAFMLVQPVYGFFLFLAAACYNTLDYYGGSDRKEVESYLGCFQNVLRMMAAAEKVEKLGRSEAVGKAGGLGDRTVPKKGAGSEKPGGKPDPDALGSLCVRMRAAREGLRAFQKGSYWLSGKGNISGGIEAVFADLIRMIFHLDLIRYNGMLGEIQRHRGAAETLLETLGELDCAIAAASFRASLPVWCRPVFHRSMDLRAFGLYHPLVKEPVPNDLKLEKNMLLTGSNASGKSTFLKNVAINAILAQTIATCTASSYQAPMSQIYTSMALVDNLEGGESYFMVEIRSLKRILDAAEQEGAVLCMVDEVLRGTNTIERIAASSVILQSLCRGQVRCFAATHDIELTYILEDLYENYHFGERVGEEDVRFSYTLKKGRASSRNAIRLLEMMGYGDEITKGAGGAARMFEENGVWKKATLERV